MNDRASERVTCPGCHKEFVVMLEWTTPWPPHDYCTSCVGKYKCYQCGSTNPMETLCDTLLCGACAESTYEEIQRELRAPEFETDLKM